MKPIRITAPWVVLIVGSIIVFAVWALYANISLGRPVAKWGVFGDKFGALNTLFTGLAFVGLLSTLWYQIKESQKREVETLAFKESLSRTAAALEHQAKTAERDQYLTALVARIEGYKYQIGKSADAKMTNELDLLFWELAEVLWRVREKAGGTAVTDEDRAERIKNAELFETIQRISPEIFKKKK